MSSRFLALALTLIVLAVAAYYVVSDRTTPYTTDAYVQAFVVQVAPRVDGQVTEVLVEEGAEVKAGDALFRLDPKPYEFEVERLTATLAVAQSKIAGLKAQLQHYEAVVSQREADVEFSQKTYDRLAKLTEESFSAEQRLDEANDTLRSNTAMLAQAKADVLNTQTQLQSMVGDEHSEVAQVQAELRNARFNLEQTTIYSGVDGNVENLQLRSGTYLTAGSFVMSLIDNSRYWVVANYPENALSVIRPGQPVKLSFFMYPGHIFEGTVDAIGTGVYRGQGLADGLLSNVDNPSAWITLSQRFEVRIDPNVPKEIQLRVGATARTLVITGDYPVMNTFGRVWLKVGSLLDFIY